MALYTVGDIGGHHAAGEIEFVKVGRRTLVPAESLAAYVQRLRAE